MGEMNPVSRFLVNRSGQRRAAGVLRELEPVLRSLAGGRVLELGAGRGGLSALIFERFHPARLVVTDFDPHQIEEARTYLGRRFGKLPSTIEIRRVDATSLPFEDRSFDGVFAILMLHHVEADPSEFRQRPVALREIRRVLAPGGCLAYSDFRNTDQIRQSLEGLGFARSFERRRWPRRELAVVRLPPEGF